MNRAVFKNISGAPFKIGQDVKIVGRSDDTVSAKFIRRKGTVVHFDFSCGCGQSYPDDPMIGVLFSCGTIEEFWREELRVIQKLKPQNSGGILESGYANES